jgi:tRNA modification GTPase
VLHVTDSPVTAIPESGLLIVNKADLGVAAPPSAHLVSATRGDGIAALREHLAGWARDVLRPGEPALLAHARHREAFAAAGAALAEAADSEDSVLRAESLRHAAAAFGRIAGRVGVDDVLDRIFSRFCIGK